MLNAGLLEMTQMLFSLDPAKAYLNLSPQPVKIFPTLTCQDSQNSPLHEHPLSLVFHFLLKGLMAASHQFTQSMTDHDRTKTQAVIYQTPRHEMKNKSSAEQRGPSASVKVKDDALHLCLHKMLIWCSHTMVMLIYVPQQRPITPFIISSI